MESALCPVPPGTRLIETFGWWPDRGIPALGLHLNRLSQSAAALGFAFQRERAQELAHSVQAADPLRCRMTLDAAGALDLTHVALPPSPAEWAAIVSQTPLDASDPWLRIKSTNRALYDQTRADLPPGIGEALFFNTDGHLCEGTITNLFVTLADGQRVTPALSCGLLPGIYRHQELATGRAKEALITRTDLQTARSITAANALRGEIPLRLRL